MIPFQLFFESQPSPLLILSPEFYVQAATDAFLKEAQMKREAILGKFLFDLFPDNPDQPLEPSLSLKYSLETSLATGAPHIMAVTRYDIPDPAHPGSFLERYWQSKNIPILDSEGKVSYIIHEASNVTEQVQAAHQLAESRKRESEALAKAEQQRIRLERLFAQAPAGLAILEGPDLVYKVVNTAYQELFPGRELLGRGLFEALPELKDQPIASLLQEVYRTGETYEGRELLVPLARYQDGPLENIYLNFIYQALLDDQGQVNGLLNFALDVTDFVQTRQQLEKSGAELQNLNQVLEERVVNRTAALQVAQAEAERQRHRLENLFLKAPAPICILSGPNLVYELVNPSYEQLFPGRHLLGKPILEVLPEIANNHAYTTFRQVYATGVTHKKSELLFPIRRPEDGMLEDRYFRYIQQARRDENGQIDGVLVYAFEITEQVQALQAIEQSEQQLRLVTDALPVLISYLDKDERYRFANKAYEAWFNLHTPDMMGKPLVEVIGEKAYQNVKPFINRALTGERLDFEAIMHYREDFSKHTHITYVPNIIDGEVTGVYTLENDVTDQVKAREALETMNRELIASNSELDNFVYIASHDLKAPIANIESLLTVLLEELPTDIPYSGIIEKTINLMHASVERFKKSVSDLATVATIQKEPFEDICLLKVGEILNEILLDLEPIIKEANAFIETDLAPDSTLRFSAIHLRSIIYNVISNALKYRSSARPLRIRITTQHTGNYLVFSVSDNGLGMDLSKEGMIFKMFKRLHDHVEGSGIGLYIVNKIVTGAGGRIEVESKVDKGSTFRIFLNVKG